MFNQDRQVLGVLQRRQEQQGNYNSGKLTQLAAAATTMVAIGAKFAATKAFRNCKRIKLLRFLLNIETSHTICSLRRRKDCQQTVTKIDPRGTKINKLVVQQRRQEQQAGYYSSGFTLAAATMTATN
jgi:hypothetical protein